MKRIFYPLLTGLILLTSAAMSVAPSNYTIKDNHSIEFKSKDPSGVFKIIRGTVLFDEKDLANSKFDLSIPVSSISTGNGMMNKKAQTEEWFNAGKYPDIKFTSTKIEQSGETFNVTGNLSIKGVSKIKKIPLKAVRSGNDVTFSGSFSVNRSDYKIGHTSDAVPNTMNINYTLPVVKK